MYFMSLLVSRTSLTIEQTSDPFHPFVDIEAQADEDEDEDDEDEDEDDRKSTLGSPSLSSFPHSAVELIDDNDENDETLYQWRNVNGDDEENDHWDAVLARARQRAGGSSSQRTPTEDQSKMLPEEVLPQDSLLYPQEGDAPLWRLRCHVSTSRIP
jgi:hypothetical protein